MASMPSSVLRLSISIWFTALMSTITLSKLALAVSMSACSSALMPRMLPVFVVTPAARPAAPGVKVVFSPLDLLRTTIAASL